MKPTHELIKYMQAHGDAAGHIHTAADDPTMLQAELDGFAHREDDYWQGHGIIQAGERRLVRFIYGGEEEIIGTEEMRAECEAGR